MRYSNQLIEELSKHLDGRIVNFFLQKKDIMQFPVATVQELIEYSLNETFGGALNKEDLSPIICSLRRARVKKRSRWYASFMDGIRAFDMDDPRYPLANYVTIARTSPTGACSSVFHGLTLQEFIEGQIEAAERWRNNRDFMLIEFPGIGTKAEKSAFLSLVSDTVTELWKYIGTELNGSLSSYLITYPETLVDKPVFGPVASSMALQGEGQDSILKDVVKDENNNTILEISLPGATESDIKLIPPKTLSLFDQKLLNAFILSADMGTFYRDKTVVVSFTDLCSHIISYNPGKFIYRRIAESCSKLVKYNYSYMVGEGRTVYFNLMDNIDVDMKKKKISCTFGEVLANAIIQRELITITAPAYSVLRNNISSIICYALKKEQIINQATLSEEYTYVYFQKIVRFASNNKKTNIKLLKESLQEFVDNGIIIRNFSASITGVFTLEFLPLSDAEMCDLGIRAIEEPR